MLMESTPTQCAVLPKSDYEFLHRLAARVLGNSSVAVTTATTLSHYGFEPQRVATLLAESNVPVKIGAFTFKKVEPDLDAPENFGLLVRKSL